MQESPVR